MFGFPDLATGDQPADVQMPFVGVGGESASSSEDFDLSGPSTGSAWLTLQLLSGQGEPLEDVAFSTEVRDGITWIVPTNLLGDGTYLVWSPPNSTRFDVVSNTDVAVPEVDSGVWTVAAYAPGRVTVQADNAVVVSVRLVRGGNIVATAAGEPGEALAFLDAEGTYCPHDAAMTGDVVQARAWSTQGVGSDWTDVANVD